MIVSLLAPYDSITDSDELGRHLIEVFRLKLAGYQAVHGYGVLPIDTYDFISNHHLFGFEENGRFRLVTAYRSVSLGKCVQHRLPFPALSVLRSSGEHRQAEVVERNLEQWKGTNVNYSSSWTMAPEFRHDRAMHALLRDMLIVMLVNDETDGRTDHSLLCGVPKVRTDHFFAQYGYDRIESADGPLPPFEQASLFGEQAVLLHRTKFTESALRLGAEGRALWENRIVVGETPAAVPAKKAA
ncbi:MAG: hypothetical protein JST04_08120 [Bdellovibrionales bacterium]|nr:hypothetical protein [Bdellovibrionales bacterium]